MRMCAWINAFTRIRVRTHARTQYNNTKQDYVRQCGSQYVTRSNIRRFCRQRALFEQVSGREGVVVEVEHDWTAEGVGPNEEA